MLRECFRAPFEKVRRPVANLPKAIGPPFESLINLFLWVPVIILSEIIQGVIFIVILNEQLGLLTF